MAANQNKLSVPEASKARYQEIGALIEAFCQEKLNSEYEVLCKELTAALGRKRPSPILRGQVKSWACGIVYAIGSINFLFDKSQQPHIRADELCAWFGVAPTTGSSKSREIQKLFRIAVFDPKWTLPSRMEDNPSVWMIMVNGFIVDARMLPRDFQEEAFRQGLIPYLPEEDESSEDDLL